MKKLTLIGITLTLLLGLALWQQKQIVAAKAAPVFAMQTVTTTADSGTGSLRQAIADAASGDTITFSLSGCPCTITLTSGELLVNKSLTIQGPGASQLTVSGNNASRVFNIVAGNFNVTLSGLAIANGRVIGPTGQSGGTGLGGGISNNSTGTLNVINSRLSGNSVIGGAGTIDFGGLGMGGGIYNAGFGTVNVTSSTLSGNSATGGLGNSGYGGGIWNNYGTVNVTSSTLSGNSATDGADSGFGNTIATGGGIYNHFIGVVNLTASTLSGNSATSRNYGAGGGIDNSGGMVNARNTIIANNTATNAGPDVNGTLTSQGYNLIENTSGATITPAQPTDIFGVDPLLGPLQNNGGPTLTHRPLTGSPAIDQGNSFGLMTDQRGFPRPQDNPAIANASGGDGSDIGAYEVNCTTVVTTTADSGAGSLRQTIADACPNAVITFDTAGVFAMPQTISLTSGQLVISDALTIQGPGANLLNIHNVQGNTRVLYVGAVEATLSDLTISGGTLDDQFGANLGAGIYNDGQLHITNSTISNNTIHSFSDDYDPNLGFGDGIYNNATLWVTNSLITNNIGTSFSDRGFGGGIFNARDRTAYITNSTIRNNLEGNGGGIDNWGNLTVTNSTISNNTAQVGGGFHSVFGSFSVTNSTISGNSALNGGGIYAHFCPGTITNTTITMNHGIGGGITNYSYELSGGAAPAFITISNSIVAGNTGEEGADYFFPHDDSIPPAGYANMASHGHNIFGAVDAPLNWTFTGPGDQVGSSASPINPLLGPLADNGGPTKTHALLTGSPAIDAGDDSVLDPPLSLTTDQRGTGFARKRGAHVDIGAFEVQCTPPTITPGGPTTFCAGGSVTLTSSSATGNQWYLNGNPIGGATNQTFVATASGNYTVMAGGCSSAPTTVTVNPIPPTPTITPGGPTTFCAGSSVTLTSSSATGNQWYLNGNPIGGATNQTYVATASGNYTVVVTAIGCSSAPSAPTTVTVNPIPPTATITPGGPTTFCAGGSVTLTSSSATGNQWYLNGNPIGGATNQTYVATASGNYTVIVTASGCSSAPSAPTTVTVNPTPTTPTITPSGPTTFCPGGSVTLTSSSATGNQWYLNGNPIGGATNQTYVATASGNYTVVVTAIGCSSAPSAPTTVTVNPTPVAPTITPGGSVTFCFGNNVTLTSSSASGNQWYLNGNPIAGATNQAYVATAAGNYTVVTTVNGCPSAPSAPTSLMAGSVTITPNSLPGGTLGVGYNQSISATPSGAYSYSVTSGALPTGLTLNAANGAITGTPTTSGSFNFRITATSGNCSGFRDYMVTIACAGLTITTNSLPAGTAGAAYSQTIGVNPAAPAGSYTFSLLTGSLPSGLTLNPTSGVLSGLPSVTGSYNFTIKATAANGCAATQTYTLAITCPVVTLSALPAPALNSPYNQTITASPSGGNYNFAVTLGVLPAGVSLNAATGLVSGTSTTAGAYNFTITATGFGNCMGSRTYTGTIAGSACPTIALPDLPAGEPGQLYSNSVTATPAGSYNYAVTAGGLPPGLTLYGSFGLIFGYPTAAGTYNFTITATDSNNCTGTKNYSLSIGGTATQSLVFGDFDGDGKADLSVWRGSSGEWLTVSSSNGKLQSQAWGSTAAPYFDVMVPGDYDGDGKMDLAVFRRGTGEWLIKGSKTGAVTTKPWGLGTDVPVAGDYDGDGKTDIAIWRGSEGKWYIQRSSDGAVDAIAWGAASVGDVPVPGDYDGDGKTDVAVFRRGIQQGQGGYWYIKLSSNGQTMSKLWGVGTDVPVPGDYDGDGKTDIAVWRGSDTNWYIIQSSNSAIKSVSWGASSMGDVPVLGDYDGDGKADVAVWRESTGMWYVKCSGDGSVMSKAHGQSGDVPIVVRKNN